VNDGIDQQTAVKSHPAVKVSYSNIINLQYEYDNLITILNKEDDVVNNNKLIYQNKTTDLGFNPKGVWQFRNHEMILVKGSKLIKQIYK